MRILSVTAGAASMYCGSCLRDNAVAAALIARGHDVTLIPLYTPLRTDEENVTRPDVLFGGINIYLQHQSALFRRLPRFVDRLLDSPWLIRTFADRSVSVEPKLLGGLTISMLEGTTGVLRKEFDKLLDWLKDEPRPDIVSDHELDAHRPRPAAVRGAGRADLLHAAGRGTVPGGTDGAIPQPRHRADSGSGPPREPLHRGQRVRGALHDRLPPHTRGAHRDRAARHSGTRLHRRGR